MTVFCTKTVSDPPHEDIADFTGYFHPPQAGEHRHAPYSHAAKHHNPKDNFNKRDETATTTTLPNHDQIALATNTPEILLQNREVEPNTLHPSIIEEHTINLHPSPSDLHNPTHHHNFILHVANTLFGLPSASAKISHSHSHSHSRTHSHSHSQPTTIVPIRSIPGTPSKDAYSVRVSPVPDMSKRATEVFEYVYATGVSLVTASNAVSSIVVATMGGPSRHERTTRKSRTKTKTRAMTKIKAKTKTKRDMEETGN